MSNNTDKDIVLEIKKANMELKKKLELVSKMRVECAKLHLEMLKLYTPECAEIIESLKDVSNNSDNLNNQPAPK